MTVGVAWADSSLTWWLTFGGLGLELVGLLLAGLDVAAARKQAKALLAPKGAVVVTGGGGAHASGHALHAPTPERTLEERVDRLESEIEALRTKLQDEVYASKRRLREQIARVRQDARLHTDERHRELERNLAEALSSKRAAWGVALFVTGAIVSALANVLA